MTEPVTVAQYGSATEAEMWAELLRNAGIPALVASEAGWSRAWPPGAMSSAVQVRPEDVERARAALGL